VLYDPVAVQELSGFMFGQRYRLEVMLLIAESEGIVCLKELADALNVSPSNLQRPIKDLLAAGLLGALPPGDSKRRFYQRVESSAWEFALELVARHELPSVRSSSHSSQAEHMGLGDER
jgi:DNA-binding transcriptional ArsR family regulator